MKIKTTYTMCILLSALYTSTAYADDPCEVTLCLWGKMSGASSSQCSKTEKKFFNIVKKKKGSFQPGKTFDARKDFLNSECPSVYGVSQFIEKILQKYGKVRL